VDALHAQSSEQLRGRRGSLAAPIDLPQTRANTEPGGSSTRTGRADLNVTSPGRE